MEGRMNQSKVKIAFHFSKEIAKEIFYRFRLAVSNNRASLDLSGTALEKGLIKTAEVIIGSTTYLVSCFYKKNAKGNVVDKIGRLIERDAESIIESVVASNTTGNPGRFVV